MSFMASPSLILQALSTERLLNDLWDSPNRFAMTSILWDGDVYDLPPEMLSKLPATYVVPQCSRVITSVYDMKGTKDTMQDELSDVLEKFEEGYEDGTSSWGRSQKPQNEVESKSFLPDPIEGFVRRTNLSRPGLRLTSPSTCLHFLRTLQQCVATNSLRLSALRLKCSR